MVIFSMCTILGKFREKFVSDMLVFYFRVLVQSGKVQNLFRIEKLLFIDSIVNMVFLFLCTIFNHGSVDFFLQRQQFTLRAVERDVRQRVKTNFVRRCLIGWKKVIERKRAALLFHNQQLVKQTFVEWRYKAIHQMKERLATKEEQVNNSDSFIHLA